MKVTVLSLILILIFFGQLSSQSPTNGERSLLVMPDDHPYSHFLFSDEGDGPERIFGIGVFTSLLHPRHFQKHDPNHNRIPDDEFVSLLREHFNMLYTRFTYVSDDVTRPALFDSLRGDQAMITGPAHLGWWMASNYKTGKTQWLTAKDQETLHERIDRQALRRELWLISEFAGASNLIINTSDEPEYGSSYGDNWYFTGETKRLLYEEAKAYGLVSMGLGPVGDGRGRPQGNKLTWSKEYANIWFRIPFYHTIGRTSMSWQQLLDFSLREYANSYDLIYLNSYAFKIHDPANTGAIVREILHHPTVNRSRPVWPWISTENFRYERMSTEEAVLNIRRQVYSAIANEASGIMFYPDVRVRGKDNTYDETLWEVTLDIAAELNDWRWVLEQGEFVANHSGANVEWILYAHENDEYLFLVNHSRDELNITDPGTVAADAYESGIWKRSGTEDFIKQ